LYPPIERTMPIIIPAMAESVSLDFLISHAFRLFLRHPVRVDERFRCSVFAYQTEQLLNG
jgi:hypothetical protein